MGSGLESQRFSHLAPGRPHSFWSVGGSVAGYTWAVWFRSLALVLLVIAVALTPLDAQSRRRTSSPAAPKSEPAKVTCPSELGDGVKSGRRFCDILVTGTFAEGAVIALPPHRGTATLTFDLHNRHTYSEQQIKAGKAFAEYTATIRVLPPEGEPLARAAVISAFRSPADLVDRIGSGAGPTGLKAVAPVGTEPVTVTLPAGVTEVSLVGERLVVQALDGRSVFTAKGRPVAIVSNVMVTYTPAPPPSRRR